MLGLTAGGLTGLRGRAIGTAAGLLLDRSIGEPPVSGDLHPVALFGTAMQRLERRIYADDRMRGAILAGVGTLGAAAAGRLVGSSAAASYLSCGGQGLHRAALDVGTALEAGDLPEARSLLPHLVGRDPRDLDSGEVARATVESVAENTTDAIVAPALWTVLAGPAGAFAHRAIDTLDSMVGYRNARYLKFGSPAARLDDVAAWLPARTTALLVALVRPKRARTIWETVRRDAPSHPSPNAGVAEAAFAGALDVRLGGVNRYGDTVEERPPIGSGRPVAPADIGAAVALSRHATLALVGLLITVGLWR